MKYFLACALLAGCLFANAKDIVLKGLRIVPVDSTVVESFTDDMNFCFATRFSDGQIHLEHSKGIHTVTEYGCYDFSPDNGRSWETNVPQQVFGASCFENLKGQKVRLGCWDTKKSAEHKLQLYTMDAEGTVSERAASVRLPYASSLLLHRSVIRLRNSGKLLATAYALKQGAPKHHVLLLESADDGDTWHFLADVAEDREAVTKEGPNEPTIAELKDGTLFCAWRDGGPLKYSFSHDGGRSWEPESVYDGLAGAVDPQALVMENGTLVVITGRPNLYLLIDPTGTGRDFRKMELYHGSGSSYASVMETDPGEVLTIHDESSFSGGHSATPFSRIVADRYRILQEEAVAEECLDPRGKGFTLFYSAVAGLLPFEIDDFKPCLYLKHTDDKALIWSEIVQVPERPQPILRLCSHGDEKLQHNTAWPLVAKELPTDTERMAIECEFRLMEPQLASPQLSISGIVGYDGNGTGRTGYASFANDRVQVLTDGGFQTIPCDLSNGFHKFRMELDYRKNSLRIFKDGAPEAFFEGELVQSVYAPKVSFGDGATDVYGTVDISYFGCKY